jgi:isopentenyl-diphosphate delta-isomerase
MLQDVAERVILVDANGHEVGSEEKLAAHRLGVLHRAFSVLIWNGDGRLLLQQRHPDKYHSGGLWTNTCCGHPRPGEAIADAAHRRLSEEMGIACPLESLGSLTYRAELADGLVEHEHVTIFRGTYDGPIHPDPAECDAYAWIDPSNLAATVAASPERYTAWFANYVAARWPLEASGLRS